MKKGTIGVVAGLITLVIVFIVLWGITWIWYEPLTRAVGDDLVCKLSIIVKSFTNEPLQHTPVVGDTEAVKTVSSGTSAALDAGGAFGIKCKTTIVEVSSDSDEKEVLETIAKTMARCWNKMGEGKYDIYSDAGIAWDATNFCIRCSEIRLKGKEDITVKVEDLGRFLVEEIYTSEKMSYAGYITGVGTREDLVNELGGEGVLEIKQEHPLYVVYVVDKNEELTDRLLSAAAAAGQTFIGIDFLQKGKASKAGIKAIMNSGGKRVLRNAVGKVFLGGAAGWFAVGAGVSRAVFVNGGYNANVYLYNSEEIKNVCKDLTV